MRSTNEGTLHQWPEKLANEMDNRLERHSELKSTRRARALDIAENENVVKTEEQRHYRPSLASNLQICGTANPDDTKWESLASNDDWLIHEILSPTKILPTKSDADTATMALKWL